MTEGLQQCMCLSQIALHVSVRIKVALQPPDDAAFDNDSGTLGLPKESMSFAY